MSKLRIYELAKELGVDNKVVIQHALELGLVSGKVSHSNSLSSDEADQIRRSVIRSAIGVAPQKQVVTTRVDFSTGEERTVVESRSGNVIRRRKQASDGSSQAETMSASSQAAMEEPHQPVSAVSARSQGVEQGLSSEPSFSAGSTGHAAASISEHAESAKTPVITALKDSNGHPAHVASREEVAAPSDDSEATIAPQEEAQAPGEVAKESKVAKIGPKVLGKIELPQKKAPVRSEERKPVAGVATKSAAGAGEEPAAEDGEKRQSRARRTRKREISRIDLVDYDGSAPKRGPRGQRKSVKGAKDDSIEAMVAFESEKPKSIQRTVKLGETITVADLAKQMSVKSADVIAKLMDLGVMATINQVIDRDTATVVAEEFSCLIESTSYDESIALESEKSDDPATLKTRPPVVTVMGHVDHGKTSLLDKIRRASVAAKEHGGITQHIGAYSVSLGGDRSITFIDTPGHEAFTAMRARGAEVTDIVVLVVAADDGVMMQTIEAINHAKAAKVSILVAVNKIDRPGANVDRIKQQLVEHGLQPEEWGGDTMFFPVSALNGTGIKELLEGILLLADVKELKANPDRKAKGAVIETKQERGRGTVITVLVQTGTLSVGDVFVSGANYGRVRSMVDHNGDKVERAGPSTPVEITGYVGEPLAGDDFLVVESEAVAREVALNRTQRRQRLSQRALMGALSLEEFAKRTSSAAAADLNVILKADTHGSVEAVKEALEKLSTPKVTVRVLHASVGGITESDVQLASASNTIIVGFGVRGEQRALAEAEQLGIQVRFYRIIYELLDDVRKAMTGLLAPLKKEISLGRVEVRDIFSIPKVGTVAGCYVVDGIVRRGALVRLLRDSKVVHEGKMQNLRRFKDDVREVQSGYECGISLEGYNDVKAGDMLEVYEFQEVAQSLD